MFKLRTFALYSDKCLNANDFLKFLYTPPGWGKEREGGVLAWIVGRGDGMRRYERNWRRRGGNEKAVGQGVVGSAAGGLPLCPAQSVWRCPMNTESHARHTTHMTHTLCSAQIGQKHREEPSLGLSPLCNPLIIEGFPTYRRLCHPAGAVMTPILP